MCNTVLEGIIIGGSGGALAGITILVIQWIGEKTSEYRDKRKIYNWLMRKMKSEQEMKYRNTRTIASWTNLTEDRVRYICSCHKRIHLSVGAKEDMWSVFNREKAD
jgi:hypothetical protein